MTDRTPQFLPVETLQRARALFPHIAAGRVYLNHAATSPLSARVIEAIRRHLVQRSEGTVETYGEDVATVEACRALVCQFIRAESPERIAFVCNTSDGLNIVSSGLTWRSGDRVLLNDMEFPANIHPYAHLRSRGVLLDILKADRSRITPEMVERSIRPTTRIVALSAVQYLTGHRTDLEAIGSLCRKRGVWFIVDGIQAVGAIPIDVRAMNVDALAAGAQKWQMSPHGSGFLYLTEALQAALQQSYVGWLSVADPWQFSRIDQPLAASAKRYEGGTLNFPSIIGMKAALETLMEFGVDHIESHILALTARLREGLLAAGMFTSVTPDADNERAGIITFAPSDGRELTPLLTALQARKIDCSLREGKLRFSPHFYNSPMEIDATIAAVREILGGK